MISGRPHCAAAATSATGRAAVYLEPSSTASALTPTEARSATNRASPPLSTGSAMPVDSTSSPPRSKRAARASSITCTQRTGASSRSAPATTLGSPRRTASSASTSATVGSIGVTPSEPLHHVRHYRRRRYTVSLGATALVRQTGMGERGSDQMKHVTHWIGGKPWTGAAAGQRGDIYNPATGQVTGTVDFAGAAEVGAAVQWGAPSYPGWAQTSLVKRAAVMFAFRELVRRHHGELAALISAEHGKVASDAAGEVARGLEVVEFACGIPHLLKGAFSENVSTGVDAYSIRQPLGVVAGITPFNFPAMVPMWMFPIAIAAGNSFILKPSEKDPSTSMLLAELLAEAGLPDGVFSVVHGGKDAGDALLIHPEVRAVSFVGSTPVARYVSETGTSAGKRVQALGGAKNHMVVLPDADLDLAADAAVSAGFGSAGERCMAISVLVAVDPVGDELVARIAERVARLRVGPGDDEAS